VLRFVRFRDDRSEGAGPTRLLHFALKSWLFGFAFINANQHGEYTRIVGFILAVVGGNQLHLL